MSNPYKAKIVAASKKNTDRTDARSLAGTSARQLRHDTARSISAECRKLVRCRYTLLRHRIDLGNFIHGMLKSVRPKGTPSGAGWINQVRRLNDYGMGTFLSIPGTIGE